MPSYTVAVGSDGTWTLEIPASDPLPYATYTERSRQIFNGVTSDYTAPKTFTVLQPDPATAAFIAALPQLPTSQYVDRVNSLFVGLKNLGVWGSIIQMFDHACPIQGGRVINMRAPGTLNATLVNSPSNNALGIAGDGAAAYVDYGLHSTITGFAVNSHAAIFVSSDTVGVPGAGPIWGSTNTGGPFLNPATSNGSVQSRDSTADPSYDSGSTAYASGVGAYALSRPSSATYKAFRRGAAAYEVTRATTATDWASTAKIRGLWGASGYSTRTISFAMHTPGLSDANVMAVMNLLAAFYSNTGVVVQ